MKNTVKKDLQSKTQPELIKLLQDAQAQLMTLKLDHEQNKLQNTSELSTTRKQIAVLQTILNMKQKSAAKEKAEKPAEVAEKVKEVKKG